MEEEVSNYMPAWYYYNLEELAPYGDYKYEDFTFLHDVADVNGYTFDEENLVFFDDRSQVVQVDKITYSNQDLYNFLGEQLRDIEEIELESGIDAVYEQADTLAKADVLQLVNDRIVEIANREFLTLETYDEDLETKINELATAALVALGMSNLN